MEFFGLQKDALLLHIKRVRTADGEPIFEENIFVPFDAYRELLTADLEDKSIFAEVERVGGTPIVSVATVRSRPFAQCRAGGRAGHCSARSAAQPACGFTGPNDEPVLLGKQYYVGSRYVMVM